MPETRSTFTKPFEKASPFDARMPEIWLKPPGESVTSGSASEPGFAGSPETTVRRSVTSPSEGPPACWTATFERSVAFCLRPQNQTGVVRRREDGRPAYARPARPSTTGVAVRTVAAAADGEERPPNVTRSVPPRLPASPSGMPRARRLVIASAYVFCRPAGSVSDAEPLPPPNAAV